MRRFILAAFALCLLGFDADPWPSEQGGGRAGFIHANGRSGSSATCGIQEAIDRAISNAGGTTIYLPPGDVCTDISEPIHDPGGSTGIIFQGTSAGHVGQPGSGTHLVYTGTELAGSATITIEAHVCTGMTVNLTDGTGQFTITETAGGCDLNIFEDGMSVRVDNLDNNGGGVNNDNGGPYIVSSTPDGDNIVLLDPKERIDASTVGDTSFKIFGAVVVRSAGDWGDIGPWDVTGTSAGDVPNFIRFKTAGANTCPFAANCDRNGRAWPVVSKISATRISIDDINEIAADEAVGISVDYVASPPVVYTAESILGPETTSGTTRHHHWRDVAIIGDGDNDSDGDAFACWAYRPNNDIAASQKDSIVVNASCYRIGNGDECVGPDTTCTLNTDTDFSYLDRGIWIMGQQNFEAGPAARSNDQYDNQHFTNVLFADVSGCVYLNSIQAPQISFIGGECTQYSHYGFELESGIMRTESVAGTVDQLTTGVTDEGDAKYYAHAGAQGLRIQQDYWEGGAGVFLQTEASYDGALTVENSRIYLQDQEREDCIVHAGTSTLVLANNTFERAGAWNCDIEALSAVKIIEHGSRCVDVGAIQAASCKDGLSTVENRNYAVLPEEGFCVTTVIDAPADADDSFVFHAENALAVFSADCIIKGTTSIAATLQECGSDGGSCGTTEAAITCDADGAAQSGAIDDGVVDAGDWMHLALAVPTDAPTSLTYEFCGYWY
jgi:hypothetical protein